MVGQKILINLVLKQVMKMIEKADDKRIARSHHKKIKQNEKDIEELKKNSHPQADFVCCECGCKAKRKSK